jgi:YD repeat-containing protein
VGEAALSEAVADFSLVDNSDNGIADGGVLYTEYQYDFRGQLSQQTVFSGVDLDGDGQQGLSTQFTYDMQGRLLTTTSADSRQSVFAYDGLGRVLSEVDAGHAAEHTLRSYEYANNTVTSTVLSVKGVNHTEHLVTTDIYDTAGRLISQSQHAADKDDAQLGETGYQYDAQGRPLVQTHTNGANSYSIYDEAGRLVFTVDQVGAVVEFTYDQGSQLVGTIAHNVKQVTGGWRVSNGELVTSAISGEASSTVLAYLRALPDDAVGNRQTHHYFDDAGRKTFDVDEAGYITEYRYDSL